MITLAALLLVCTNAFSQAWEAVGSADGVSAGGSGRLTLISDYQDNLLLGYYDVSVTKGSVQKYSDGAWSYLGGSAGITTSYATYNSVSADALGNVYFTNQDSGLQVRQYNGTSWSQLPNTTTNTINYQASAVSADNVLFVASGDGTGSIKRYVNGAWEQVGTAGFFGGTAFYLDLAITASGKVYVSFNNNGYVHVYQNNVNASATDEWTPVGAVNLAAASSSENYNSCIAVGANNALYLAYVSGSAGGNKLNVKKFDGEWTQLGSENFSAGKVQHTSIAAGPNGSVYVAASIWENTDYLKNYVVGYDADTNSWTEPSPGYVSAGQATYNSLAVDSQGNLYLAFSDSSLGKISVKTLNLEGVAGQYVVVSTLNDVAATVTADGGTLQLVGTVYPTEATQGVTWTITDGATLATIDANGLLTASGNGTGTVTVTATSTASTSLSATFTVTVTSAPVSADCTFATVAVTGFNADVIAEGTGGNANEKATQPIDGANGYYAQDFVPTNPDSSGASAAAYGAGLPNNGTITSAATAGLSFQLADYNGNNALLLRNSLSNTGTLTFTEQKKAQKLYLAWVSAEGTNNVDVTVNFADGTSQVFAAQQATDWWSDATPSETVTTAGPLGRVSVITTASWAPVNSFSGLTQTYLFQKEFLLNSANYDKLIASVSFSKETSSNAATTTAILGVSICETPTAVADTYTPITITGGFNHDIIANGMGNASDSSDIGFDETNSRALVSLDFQAPGSSTTPTYGLPVNGLINSVATTGLSFQLADYNGDNALFLTPDYVGTGSSTGTLSFLSSNVTTLYLLAGTAGGGVQYLPLVATVNFADGTTQQATPSVSDWYNGTDYAIQGMGRVNRANNNLEGDSSNPRLYQYSIDIDEANQTKTITGISFSFAGNQGAEYASEIRLSVLAVSKFGQPDALPTVDVTVQAGADATITTNGGTLQLVATATPAGASVIWSVTSGAGNATVDTTGVVTAVANGTVTVRATVAGYPDIYDEVTITITNQVVAVTSVTVTTQGGVAAAITTDAGTLQLVATVLPADATDADVTWSIVSGSDFATVDENGLVTAVANGTVVVRATAADGTIYGEIEITVSGQVVAVESVTVTTEGDVAATITTAGGTLQLEATVLPADATNADVTWSIVSGAEYATVDENGLVTAVANGTVVVRATAADGTIYGEIEITVSGQVVAVESVTVTTEGDVAATITTAGGTLQLVATVLPADATNADVTWSVVSGSDFATVDENGLVTAVANGTVVVRATAADGTIYGEIEVTIDIPLGTETVNANLFTVYPNPATDVVFIKTTQTVKEVNVFNMLGSLLYTTTAKEVQLSGLASGNYIMTVTFENGTVANKKIIKQ
ncbi:Ig-like domain-containing protein [Flavobacterium sp. RHBU_3]|uniref:Ig-like domain-containing protein n=1 Tax=Flavobacterium sp. RHBU_3 TaxID=3391184 RepID=UPI0039847EEF